MSVLKEIRTKQFLIALAAAAGTLVMACALGAALVVKGVIGENAEFNWICGSYLAASVLGGIIAAKGKKGKLLISVISSMMFVLLMIILTLILYGGVSVSNGEWKILPCSAAGGILAGFLGSKNRKGRTGTRGGRARAARTRLRR